VIFSRKLDIDHNVKQRITLSRSGGKDAVEQLALFSDAGQSKGLPKDLVEYMPGFIGQPASDNLLERFIKETPWKQTTQKLWDKEYLTPRLTAWFGDTDRIAGILPWTHELQAIREKAELLAGTRFNTVLLNYYRDGNDSVAWHSDKESIMGSQPIIASVSFGQVRSFDIRNKSDHKKHFSVRLEHGSFLLMKAGLQENWEHRIAKSAKPMRPRVNLTFRLVI
jgi:alkylated DNA repair dioxygenase AlkB